MADNIMETVAELRRLEAEATPGKWCYDDGITDNDTGERGKCRAIERYGGKPSESLIAILDVDLAYARRIDVDGRLIVAMRNNLGVLLDYIERKEAGRG